MKTWSSALAIAALCLTNPAASGEAPQEIDLGAPALAAEASGVAAADLQPSAIPRPEITSPTAEPLTLVPWGGPGGGDDQLGTCVIYCDGQPYPLQMTYDECCGGAHLCPNGNFSDPGTYWSPNYGSPVLCMY